MGLVVKGAERRWVAMGGQTLVAEEAGYAVARYILPLPLEMVYWYLIGI